MAGSHTGFRAWSRSTSALGRRQVAAVVGWGLVDILAATLQALLAGRILFAALASVAPGGRAVGAFALLALLRAASLVMAERAAFEAGAAARRQLRGEVFARLLAIGPSLLRTRHSVELAGLATDKIDALEGYFARWRPAQILAVAGPLLVLAVMLTRDALAAGVLALAGLLVPLALALAGIGAKAAMRGQFLAMERLQVRFLDRVRGIATLIALGRAEAETASLAVAAEELRRRTMAVLRVAFLSSVALDLAAAAALVTLAVRAAAATLAPGSLGTLLLVPVFFAPLRGFAAAYQDRSHATAAAEGLEAVPAAPAPTLDPVPPVRMIPAHGVAVAFEDVTLHWDPARPAALDQVSFRVAAGETLVLAGPSGSGKSSVIALLLGFVAADAGRVRLNGIDIANIAPQALARLVGWIGQQPTLFAATIEENIRFARPEASEAELREAIRAARLDAVTAALPLGLATPIGEGGHGLSGGQAQRVAIARAFLRDAPLLLLDEPTSHLDPATEQEVLDSLRRLALGRTVILATHSAAARAFAGRRLDLRDGRVVSARLPVEGAIHGAV